VIVGIGAVVGWDGGGTALGPVEEKDGPGPDGAIPAGVQTGAAAGCEGCGGVAAASGAAGAGAGGAGAGGADVGAGGAACGTGG